MPTLDRETLEAALVGYEHYKKEIETKIEQLRAHVSGHVASVVSAPSKSKKGKRVVSPEARQRMAAGQQKRWAAKRADENESLPKVKSVVTKTVGNKRAPMSAEGRERIAAAQRKRWGKAKKAGK